MSHMTLHIAFQPDIGIQPPQPPYEFIKKAWYVSAMPSTVQCLINGWVLIVVGSEVFSRSKPHRGMKQDLK